MRILYVYKGALQAWPFVSAREAVNRLKAERGRPIQVDLFMKNNDGSHRFYQAGIDRIDNPVPEKYRANDLTRLLGPSRPGLCLP